MIDYRQDDTRTAVAPADIGWPGVIASSLTAAWLRRSELRAVIRQECRGRRVVTVIGKGREGTVVIH